MCIYAMCMLYMLCMYMYIYIYIYMYIYIYIYIIPPLHISTSSAQSMHTLSTHYSIFMCMYITHTLLLLTTITHTYTHIL